MFCRSTSPGGPILLLVLAMGADIIIIIIIFSLRADFIAKESYQFGAHTSNTNHKAYLRAGRRDLCALLYQKNPTLLELFVVPQHINYHMRADALTASPLTAACVRSDANSVATLRSYNLLNRRHQLSPGCLTSVPWCTQDL